MFHCNPEPNQTNRTDANNFQTALRPSNLSLPSFNPCLPSLCNKGHSLIRSSTFSLFKLHLLLGGFGERRAFVTCASLLSVRMRILVLLSYTRETQVYIDYRIPERKVSLFFFPSTQFLFLFGVFFFWWFRL